MTSRITKSDLAALVARLNIATGNPAEPYSKGANGQWTPNAGNYHLSGAYGGHALHQMAQEGTGTRDVFYSGHVPARELYYRLDAYLRGVESH
jgi:hypothetical protein